MIGTLVLDVVLVVHVLDVLPGVVLGLLTIDEVHSLGLGELVDFSTCETDEELLGELVGNWLACENTRISTVSSCKQDSAGSREEEEGL